MTGKLFGGRFDTADKRKRLKEIIAESASDPHFWEDRKQASILLKEKKYLEDSLALVDEIQKKFDDLDILIDFGEQGDGDSAQEADMLSQRIQEDLKDLEIRRLLTGNTDSNDAIITVNAGAGGTEACDWAQMILRMLLRFCAIQKWRAEVVDELAGDGAGLRNATVTVEGSYAYGLLKSEHGVHRLVRVSPFDANAKRHTSFCSVSISPVIDDTITIDIKDSDLRIDTFRAGGAGGQHVNRTDSAVRMTHIPTGIVVQNQSQRSQLQNRESCLKILKAKLYDLERQKQLAETHAFEASKMDNAFGSQIRSYVLHPYKMAKDTRTGLQVPDPLALLDGQLKEFSLEYLRQLAAGSFKGKA